MNLDILVIGAHPDDAELGCGATIARYKHEGKRVGILDCSNGEPTPYGTIEKRLSEASKSAKILGVDVRRTLDMNNRYIEETVENRKKIAEVLREFRPTIVITHPPRDTHHDHVVVSSLVSAARFQAKLTRTESKLPEWYVPRVLYFDHSHLRERRTLDFLVDVTGFLEKKVEALMAYESQFLINTNNTPVLDFVRARAGALGYMVGVRHAEGFTCPEHFLVDDLTKII